MWEVLVVPFAACVVLTGIHCYLGIHVVMREVIFVDLALAQIAAMGAAAGTLLHFELHTPQAYACSLGFTFIGDIVPVVIYTCAIGNVTAIGDKIFIAVVLNDVACVWN